MTAHRDLESQLISKRCIELVRRVLADTISLEIFRSEWPIAADGIGGLWELMHLAENVLVDMDIRMREPEYGVAAKRRLESSLASFEHEQSSS